MARFHTGFVDLIRQYIRTAVEAHELPATEDPRALALELNGVLLAADTNFVMYDDPAVLELGRRVVRRRLGVETPGK